MDIFNFSNLVNKNWGRKFFIPSLTTPLVVEQGGPDPQFSWRSGSDDLRVNTNNTIGSRWVAQLGVRYTFK